MDAPVINKGIISKMIKRIEKKGWKKDWGTANGASCLVGTYNMVRGCSHPDSDVPWEFTKFWNSIRNGYQGGPVTWNDTPGRKKSDVLAMLTFAKTIVPE